ncbi:unnamed protein product [Closterium sp. Naga37s-1]|nr:unnamed protein product [Closterium sp. Naga37s-1]
MSFALLLLPTPAFAFCRGETPTGGAFAYRFPSRAPSANTPHPPPALPVRPVDGRGRVGRRGVSFFAHPRQLPLPSPPSGVSAPRRLSSRRLSSPSTLPPVPHLMSSFLSFLLHPFPPSSLPPRLPFFPSSNSPLPPSLASLHPASRPPFPLSSLAPILPFFRSSLPPFLPSSLPPFLPSPLPPFPLSVTSGSLSPPFPLPFIYVAHSQITYIPYHSVQHLSSTSPHTLLPTVARSPSTHRHSTCCFLIPPFAKHYHFCSTIRQGGIEDSMGETTRTSESEFLYSPLPRADARPQGGAEVSIEDDDESERVGVPLLALQLLQPAAFCLRR